jgi:hypothetical protein
MKGGRNRDAAMEFAPIPGITALSAVKALRIESWQSSVFDIDASQKPEDRKEKGNARKAGGAQEDGEDEEYELAPDDEMEPGSDAHPETLETNIDYFA